MYGYDMYYYNIDQLFDHHDQNQKDQASKRLRRLIENEDDYNEDEADEYYNDDEEAEYHE